MGHTHVIDGSYGEGGGQIVRSALTLALLTGSGIRIENIRAGRPKAGLRPQHLESVEAAARIGRARVNGAVIGSRTLAFEPGHVEGGTYRFDIGTAGSAVLVVQTVALPLWLSGASSRVTVTGGTHVPWSPCVDYLEHQWLHHLARAGLPADLALERAGFYPRGGGRVTVAIEAAGDVNALELTERGRLREVWGISAVANLATSIAERQRTRVLERLSRVGTPTKIDIRRLPSNGRGTLLFLVARFERSQCCYFALGQRGKPAETVADEAVDSLEAFLRTDGVVDQYLADQLLLPLGFAGGVSEIRTSKVTRHLLTNAWVLAKFWPAAVTVDGVPARDADFIIGRPALIRIDGVLHSSVG